MFALSPENTLRNSRYSIGITLRGSSGGSVAMALASSQCGVGRRVSIGDSRNIALPVSWLSFFMVLSLTRQMSIASGVRIGGFSGVLPFLRSWNVIFVSTQSMLGLCCMGQSYPRTTEYSSSSLVTNRSIMCDSLVENVIGRWHCLSMVDVVNPSNILSRIALSK